MSAPPVTHADLVRRAVTYLRRRRCVIYGTEVNATAEVPDAIGWTCWGETVLVECKASRADLLADAKKPHRAPGAGMGRERVYLAPPGVVTREDLSDGWGLVEARPRLTVAVVHPAPREAWDRHADALALLHLARRACDYDPSALHAKIEAERERNRERARAERERRRHDEREREAALARLEEKYPGLRTFAL